MFLPLIAYIPASKTKRSMVFLNSFNARYI